MTTPSQQGLAAPIFIVGPGRSGTTLLRSILSAHSRIAIAPETHYMARVEGPGLLAGGPADFESFWSRYTEWVRFKDLGVPQESCRRFLRGDGSPSFREIFVALLLAYREQMGKERVGEKTPGHSRFLPILLEWFPDAQFLVTTRDPRAVVASQLRTPYVRARLAPFGLRGGFVSGSRAQEVSHFAENWRTIFERRIGPWRSDGRVHMIAYEELVGDPEGAVQRVCRFLGETYEQEMLTDRSDRSGTTPAAHGPDQEFEAWREVHHRKSRQPISQESLDRWRNELSPTEVAMIEGICYDVMVEQGYHTVSPSLRRAAGTVLAGSLLRVGLLESRLRGRDVGSYLRARAEGPRSGP